MNQIDLLTPIIVDNFAGGGGASTGIELATGMPVTIAINHDPDAINGGNYSVIPGTVGQFTGLTDKNGKKIFEGDILKGKAKSVYPVEYSGNIAGFVTRGIGVLSTPCMNYGTMKLYEVIGNIHDNPELLEAEK